MIGRITYSVLALLAPAALGAQQAQRDTFRLSEIVVTATRLPTPRASVASTVTVISGERLRASGVRYVADALRLVAGAAVTQGGSFGATTSLFLRGGQSNYVQVLVDGVPLNGPGGAFDFGPLTADNVERIEIVAGPTSVLYGSNAVSGVIHILTRRGRGRPSAEVGVRAGTYGSLEWDVGLQGAAEHVDYSFSASRFTTSGSYPFNNHHRNSVASARVHVAPDDRTDGTLTLRHADQVFHFPTDGAGRLVDRNQFTYEDGVALGLDVGRYLANRVEARVQLTSHQTDGGFDNRPDTPADTLGFYFSQSLQNTQRRSADLRTNLYLPGATTLTVGAQLEHQKERDVDRSESQFGPSAGSNDFDRLNRAYYAQALLEAAGGVSLTLGGRVDDNETFGPFATYRLGASYRAPGGARIRASIGTGFKEPTFFENFSTAFSTGNPDLRPERSTSWEVGLERTVGSALISATSFSQRFRDLVQYTPTPPTSGGPNYFNVAAAKASGVELSVRVFPVSGLSLEGQYTNLQTEVTSSGFDSGADATFVKGDRLLRRPTHLASLALRYAFKAVGSAGAAIRYVGDRADRDFSTFPAPRVLLPAYIVVDFSAEYAVTRLHHGLPGLTGTLRVENALDRKYGEIANFPARGRTVMAGGRVKI